MRPVENWERRKVLVLCQRGNSRSVCLSWILKERLKADAIAAGIEAASDETLEMLCRWADVVIVVDKTLRRDVVDAHAAKVRVWDVGPDVWFRGFKRELTNIFKDYLQGSRDAA